MSSQDLSQLPPYSAVDFKALAKKNEDFQKIWSKSSGHLDFQDAETMKTLSKAILNTDFSLDLYLPDDRLCPPIPNRWNYVTWIQRLIDSTSTSYSDRYDPGRQVVGLDIGVGASAIYTMLCLRSRPNWTMCATDIDQKSFDSAVRNLTLNNLVTRTKMLHTIDSNPLIPLRHLGVEKLDFTICNPPFYANEEEMRASLKGEGKGWRPNAVCTGSLSEMVCNDGDLGFVARIVEESLILREKVTWYSSLLGKLNSAKAIVDLLKQHSINNWTVGCIDAGGATKRWTVAWSFGDYRPRNDVARIEKIANEYLPFPTEYRIQLPDTSNCAATKLVLNEQLTSLDLHWAWNSNISSGIGEATQNVWKRAYRRAYERKNKESVAERAQDAEMASGDKKVELAFRISVHDGGKEVVIDWLRGTDQVLWESFCGMVHRNFKKP